VSLTVAPSASYEASLELGISGLVGTLALGTYDGDTATQALATTTINEIGTTGIYVATRTSPGTAGQYVLVWSEDGTLDPDKLTTEDLLVTTEEVAAPGGTSNLYISSAEIIAALRASGTTFLDDDVALAVVAASRAIDGYKRVRGYFPVAETRVFTARYGDVVLLISDLVTLTSLKVDEDGDGTHETTWTLDTDFVLQPANAALEGRPYNRVQLLSQEGRRFPRYVNAIEIVGTFGWAATPVQVKQAAKILATRLVKRVDTPYAIMTVVAGEMVEAARLGRIDPDVAAMLDSVPPFTPGLASVRLG